jgi:hypothetical protein
MLCLLYVVLLPCSRQDTLSTLNVNITNVYEIWTRFRWGTSLSFGRAFCNIFR